jgi:hypothetical protein
MFKSIMKKETAREKQMRKLKEDEDKEMRRRQGNPVWGLRPRESPEEPFAASEPVTEFKFPSKRMQLKEVIEKHQAGPVDNFTITTTNAFSKKDMNNVLMKDLRVQEEELIDLGSFPVNDLKHNFMEFNMDAPIIDALVQKKKKTFSLRSESSLATAVVSKMKPYIRLVKMTFVYRPTASYTNPIHTILVTLEDRRYRNPISVRSVSFNANLTIATIFSLDYSVSKDDLADIVLTISNPNNMFKEGVVYGSLKFDLSVSESEEALTTDMLPVTASYGIGASMLASHKKNPKHLDASFAETTRSNLRTLFLKGMVVDRTRPDSEKTVDFSRVMGSAADSEDLQGRDDDFEVESDAGKGKAVGSGKAAAIARWSGSVQGEGNTRFVNKYETKSTQQFTPPPSHQQPARSAMKQPQRHQSPHNPFGDHQQPETSRQGQNNPYSRQGSPLEQGESYQSSLAQVHQPSPLRQDSGPPTFQPTPVPNWPPHQLPESYDAQHPSTSYIQGTLLTRGHSPQSSPHVTRARVPTHIQVLDSNAGTTASPLTVIATNETPHIDATVTQLSPTTSYPQVYGP